MQVNVSVPIHLSSLKPLGPGIQPVTVGLPFPKKTLAGSEPLCLRDEGGRTVPVQTEVLARWPDGSAKWLLLDFLLEGVPEGRSSWSMSLEACSEPVPIIPGVATRDDGECLSIDTGVQTWTVARKSPVLLALAQDGERVQNAPTLHVALTDRKGRTLRPKWTHVEVETPGPVRTTILLEGELPGSGLRLYCRLCFFSGTGLVRVRLTVRNPHRARHRGGLWDLGDPGSVFFRDLSLEWIAGGPVEGLLAKPEVQLPAEEIRGGTWRLYQDSSGGENWQSRNHVNRAGRQPCRFCGYQVEAGERRREGRRATPVLAVEQNGRRLMVAVPEFWQQFPKSLEASTGGFRVGLFPRQWDDLFELQGGEQKTHTVWLSWQPREPFHPDALDWVYNPTQAVATPQWYTSSGALPYFLRAGDDPDDRFRTLMDGALRGPQSLAAKREIVDEYGWRNWGEVYADHENAYYPGPKPVVSHYNNQFDVIYGAILQQMRTGEAAWAEVFEPLARHVIDIDIYHTFDDRAAYSGGLFWLTDHYLTAETATHRTYSRANKRPGVPYGGGPGAEHNYATGLLHDYYLTGERQALEAVIGLADWVVAMDDGSRTVFSLLDDGPTGLATATDSPDYHGPGRGAANSINVLLDGYQATGRRAYLAKAEELIRRTIHPEDDIAARELLNVEARWSYTMYLAALAHYLDAKAEQGELDFMYAYAQASLVHYARWMAEHERPYFDHPEDLEYPTEAWAAQEFRKANALRLAAKHAEEPLRARLLARGGELADRAWCDLLRFESRHVARAIAVLMVEGMKDCYFRVAAETPAPRPNQSYDFGQPERFVPQRRRVLARLKTPRGLVQAAWALTGVFRCIIPQRRVESVLDLDIDELRAMNIEALLLDVDCTLKNYRATEVRPEVAKWLQGLRAAGIRMCLISNGRSERIRRFAEKYRLPFVSKACKPLPFGCRQAVRRLGFDPQRTAMVGDQVFADVMAGRLAGLQTILVQPIHPEEEPWFTRLKRPLERVLLRWLDQKG